MKGIEFKFTLDPNFETLFTSKYLKFIANGTDDSIAKTFSMTKGDTCTISGSGISFADTGKSTVTYSYTDKVGTFVCKFAFRWVKEFNYKNPSENYAEQDTSAGKTSVINKLNAFGEAAKHVTASQWMSVVVTPVV